MQQFLEILTETLPTFSEDETNDNQNGTLSDPISVLANYGVKRFSVSHRFSQLIHLPRNDSGDTSDVSVMSVGAKIGLLLLVLSIGAGFVLVIRYFHLQYQQRRTMFHELQSPKKGSYPEKEPSLLSQFWIFLNTGSGHASCDSTHSSLSSASGLSVGVPGQHHNKIHSTGTRKRESNHPFQSIQYRSDEPDSIYIVEPDDDVEFWLEQHSSSRSGFTDALNTSVEDRDPLYVHPDCGDSHSNEYSFDLY